MIVLAPRVTKIGAGIVEGGQLPVTTVPPVEAGRSPRRVLWDTCANLHAGVVDQDRTRDSLHAGPRLHLLRVVCDALAQDLALIESRQLVRVVRLSRQQRFVVLSVDVDVDRGLAVTSFARRGVGCTWRDVHVLARRQGQWVLLGGSSTDGDEDQDLLADRPPVMTDWSASLDPPRPAEARGRPLLLPGSTGGVHDARAGADRWPWSGRWVSHSEVRASAAVESLTIAGRALAVPWHGRSVVVWTGRRRLVVRARDCADPTVGELALTR
jgi:hypothetical protein